MRWWTLGLLALWVVAPEARAQEMSSDLAQKLGLKPADMNAKTIEKGAATLDLPDGFEDRCIFLAAGSVPAQAKIAKTTVKPTTKTPGNWSAEVEFSMAVGDRIITQRFGCSGTYEAGTGVRLLP